MIKRLALILGGLAAALLITWLILPTGPREQMAFDDPYRQPRESVTGSRYMVSTGTPWASEAAVSVLEEGGNAFDAAAAALLALNVTYGEAASFPGVAPLLIYDAEKERYLGYNGAGTAPQRATIPLFTEDGHETVPVMDIHAQLLPASPDMIISLLSEYGTRSFAEISSRAISLAEEGFPVHRMMLNNMGLNFIERLGFNVLMPYNVDVYLGGQWWRPLHHRERFTRPELAGTLREMAAAEAAVLAGGGDRLDGLQAVRDYFYEGPIARKIVDFHAEEGGLFTLEDLAGYRGYWEEPLSGSFNEYTLYANQTWTQGAVVPMTLGILEEIDLKAMGHNSPEYIHTVLQAIELAMADREAYFGDPQFVNVPVGILLSKAYAESRREAMTPGRSFPRMPDPGETASFKPPEVLIAEGDPSLMERAAAIRDTSYIAIVDQAGNAVSLTPSDFPKSPMVPGTGLTLGIRMTQFRLDPEHPAALEPGKRPRITPNPGMVAKDGEFYMAFGTPGGDMQAQAMVQMFLNHALWGMDIQEAIDAPRFRSYNFPDSFAPHEYKPGTIALEQPLYGRLAEAMEDYGYEVEEGEQWDYHFSALCAVVRDPDTGMLTGGADPREESRALGN